jgi:hypothetical protein
MKPQVRSRSQPEVLRRELLARGVRHGQIVRVDLQGVLIRDVNPAFVEESGQPIASFCEMKPITVRSRHGKGDDNPLPERVVFRGVEVSRTGPFIMENVIVRTNGVLLIEADAESRVWPAGAPV